jgi:hypothetical protein
MQLISSAAFSLGHGGMIHKKVMGIIAAAVGFIFNKWSCTRKLYPLMDVAS